MTAQPEVPDLAGLLVRLVDARTHMERVRRPPSERQETALARHKLIDALEAYTAGLTTLHAPVPYRLRDELRLNRAVDTGT
jgi:hypothetical protein